MRGEDRCTCPRRRRRRGSPPHARGRQPGPSPGGRRFRITPACAGKTSFAIRIGRLARDHPRMRGEDGSRVIQWVADVGSPPHARGRRIRRRRRLGILRITPACAGKTLAHAREWRSEQDHPRMRGEDDGTRYDTPDELGSPPHARGRLVLLAQVLRPGRITPACAGKTTTHPSWMVNS